MIRSLDVFSSLLVRTFTMSGLMLVCDLFEKECSSLWVLAV